MQPVRLRLMVARGLFLCLFLVVAGRAVHLQLFQGKRLVQLGQRQHLKEVTILPKRGAVFDRAGEPLALSLESSSVYVRPRRIDDVADVGRQLAAILDLKYSVVQQKLNSGKPFVWIKRQISPQEAEKIQALNSDGIGMYIEPTRYYPQGQAAGQLLGFVGRDSVGLEGLELQYNEYIQGETGSSVTERDALGRRVLVHGVEGLQNPPGGDIHLTLDTTIQHLAERELEAAVSKYRAKAGVAIVVEPFTGQILALANYPSFDPNQFAKQSAQQRRNRAVTDSFEPGSTFKTILAAAALEEGIVGKEDLFYCEMGNYPFAGKIIHDTHPHGWLPFSKILQVSSNIGFTKVAEKLKRERYYKYIKSFGFGESTGIDVPGEIPGTLRKVESWSKIDLATHAFGQGISTTPLQMAMAYAAIANGGILMRPFVTKKVVKADGEVVQVNQPRVVRRVISEKTAQTLAAMLKEVTNDGGTGTMANIDGFDVAGKTGTAQKADLENGGYASKKRVASFVGFVPANEPRLVSLVLIDEPQLNVYGGVVAAPVFRNIAQGALRHLAVAPKGPVAIPSSLVEREVPLTTVVKRERPASLEASGPTVPDFVGLSLREAVAKARSINARVKMMGHGYGVRQAPEPGGRWSRDDVLVLKLQG